MWPFSNAYPEVRVSEIQDEYDYVIVGEHTKLIKKIQVNVTSSFSRRWNCRVCAG
jgi:hypothetical protein